MKWILWGQKHSNLVRPSWSQQIAWFILSTSNHRIDWGIHAEIFYEGRIYPEGLPDGYILPEDTKFVQNFCFSSFLDEKWLFCVTLLYFFQTKTETLSYSTNVYKKDAHTYPLPHNILIILMSVLFTEIRYFL